MSNDAGDTDTSPFVSKHELFFETPLYDVVKKDQLEENYYTGEVDGYSPTNSIETTYTISYTSLGSSSPYIDGLEVYTLTCKRKGEKLVFFIFESDKSIVKVGQIPSLANIQYANMGKKYEKELGREDLTLFKKAIGLAAHGAGAGSFVYLRKIFEKLISETHKAHSSEINETAADFKTKRMVEKVEILKDFLPSELIEMKSVYSILSNGVHELSEKECLAYFPAIKLSIELILEQRLEEQKAKKRHDDAKAQIQAISQELKKQTKSKSESE